MNMIMGKTFTNAGAQTVIKGPARAHALPIQHLPVFEQTGVTEKGDPIMKQVGTRPYAGTVPLLPENGGGWIASIGLGALAFFALQSVGIL